MKGLITLVFTFASRISLEVASHCDPAERLEQIIMDHDNIFYEGYSPSHIHKQEKEGIIPEGGANGGVHFSNGL